MVTSQIKYVLPFAAIKRKNAVIIKNAQAVSKSYPDFFKDYNKLGGNADVL